MNPHFSLANNTVYDPNESPTFVGLIILLIVTKFRLQFLNYSHSSNAALAAEEKLDDMKNAYTDGEQEAAIWLDLAEEACAEELAELENLAGGFTFHLFIFFVLF